MIVIATKPTTQERRAFWLFLLLAIIVLGAGIGLRDPWPADEPRFALSAKQMVESGNWLIPHRGSELYADKPPTFMALQAGAYEAIGNWRVAFLLPSLLAALGTLLLVYDLARRLFDRRTGLFAAAALLAAFQFVYQAKRAQIDPTVTFFVTLANYGLLRHFLRGPDWRSYWLGCFAAGLGVITKGVGVLALFMFAPYIFARTQQWQQVTITQNNIWRWAAGGFMFAMALALWLLPMLATVYRQGTPELVGYVNDILFHQTAVRYADSWAHAQPWWYFGGVILTGWMPLTLALLGAIPAWRERLRVHDARLLLPLTWVLLVVVFFSIPAGKRDMYILPALPMAALCISPFLPDMLERVWFRRTALTLISLIGFAFLATGTLALWFYPPFARDITTQRGLVADGAPLWWLLIVLGVWTLSCAAFFRVRRGVHALLAGIAGMWLLWSFWAYPLLNDSSSAAGVMRRASQIVGAESQFGLVAWKEQNLLMADRAVVDFGFGKPWHTQLAAAILWQEQEPEKRWIFILADAMAPCIDGTKATSVGFANRREWWMFRADAVAAQCRGGKVPPAAGEGRENPNAE